jgi:UPF0716 protein FxsA
MWLFLAFLAVPLIEIALFVQIGGLIGLFPTLAIVVLTAILGTALVRTQGAAVLLQLRSAFNELRDPTEPLANGAMILFSGALLLTPGFFTDTLGFLLLIPAVRAAVFRYLRSRVKVQHFETRTSARPQGGAGDIIDGAYTEVDAEPPKKSNGEPSGWTRH